MAFATRRRYSRIADENARHENEQASDDHLESGRQKRRLWLDLAYEYRCSSSDLSRDERGNIIRLDKLPLALRLPSRGVDAEGKPYSRCLDGGFDTNLDVREGQMVAGKTNFQVENGALIAVISAKVVD